MSLQAHKIGCTDKTCFCILTHIYTYIASHCTDICTYVCFHKDIDECTRGTSGCDHNCTNTDGSYYCTCMSGYELESDNHTCTDNN